MSTRLPHPAARTRPLRHRCASFVTAGLFAAAPVLATVPGHHGSEPVPVIDVHTHVFNGHDLPLQGVLNALGVPLGVSHSLAKLLNTLTSSDDFDGSPLISPGPLAEASLEDTRSKAANALVNRAKENLASPATESLLSVLSQEERNELLEYVGQGRLALASTALPKDFATLSQKEQDLEIIVQALAKANFPPGESDTPHVLDASSPAVRSGYFSFLEVMTRRNREIALELKDRQYPDVDLFVHHMMDMERAYDSKPVVSFEEQIHRMTKLDRSFDGNFVHFVAFDPFRRDDSLESVKRGLAAGAIGVKFYPPSGFRASGNTLPNDPGIPSILKPGARMRWLSRYKDLTSARLDDLNDKLFAYCELNDIPIFTHCTPKGFEADEDYGKMADPAFWAPVLEKYKKLRLCFGHSGGHAFWFPQAAADAEEVRFGRMVADLCLKHPNVYCEVGYLEQILKPGDRELFKNRLKEQIDRPSTAPTGSWKLGNKIMYGSDWHMIHKEKGHEQYPAAFNELFTDPALKPWQRAFFCRNAIAYLKLQELTTKPGVTPGQKLAWENLLTNAAAGPATP